jgi:hypothetical protein
MAPSPAALGAWFIVPDVPTDNAHLGLDPALTDTIRHATGAQYNAYRAEGLQPYPTRAAAAGAKTAVDKAGQAGTIPGLSGIDAVGDFFSRLTEVNTWIRVGEFAVGGLLLYIGLKGLFPTAVGSVTSGAKKAVGIAALA